MIVKRFFEPLLAQASYLIGCGASGEAIVIDANRDVQRYIDAAAAEHLRITQVTETHIHADFVSGSRELAQKTGREPAAVGRGRRRLEVSVRVRRAPDSRRRRITIGNVRLEVVHTPGHTPEHLTFLVTDGAVADGRSRP